MLKIRHSVFWPPVILVVIALGLNFYDSETFLRVVQSINSSILDHFSVAFAITALVSLAVCVGVFFSKLGKVRIGGDNAKPVLNFWNWAAVVLCINTGAGILFWGIAEPIYHLTGPPASLGIAPNSPEAARFALSTLYMHWSFTPAAIFTLPAIVFALAFFNLKLPYSLSSCLKPLLGDKWYKRLATPIDALSLYTLVLGMGASLDTGVLSISGGLQHMYGIKSGPLLWTAVGSLVVVSFIASALSGLEKGIKHLSQLNTVFFFLIAVFVLVCGSPKIIFDMGIAGFRDYLVHFFDRSLFTSFSASDPWPKQWTVFYWAVWMAWAPITAGFLGRLGQGYTVKQFIVVNLLLPSLFAIGWMTLFGGTALHLELHEGMPLAQMLKTKGPESLTYAVFDIFPYASIVIPIFLLLVFISYVTAADSNTLVMAGMSSKNVSTENPDPGMALKVFWGVLVGALALLMLAQSGVEGIKTLSYLGGFPALLFLVATIMSLIVLAVSPAKFGLFPAAKSKD